MSSPTTEVPKPKTRPKLPEGWRWVKLAEVAQINPPRPRNLGLSGDEPTFFVSMSAVDDLTGMIKSPELKPFGEVCRGYTYFEEGDVLFAKITPCMQNGKHTIASGLTNGFGFGSTEFHIIRPGPSITAEWIHFYVRRPEVLSDAANHFKGAVGHQRVPSEYLENLELPLPPLETQRRIAAILTEQMEAVEKARKAAEEGLEAASGLVEAIIRESLRSTQVRDIKLSDGLKEAVQRVGANWQQFPVLGATREGLSPAKEGVGKNPQGYKLVTPESVFYNPMRITIGSIAMVDTFDNPGITSPDYVVLKGINGVIHHRWFYYWLRSFPGQAFIRSMARGAVRERLLFNRLKEGTIRIPDWETQIRASEQLAHIPALRTKIQAQLEAIRALPAAILRRAFSGEL